MSEQSSWHEVLNAHCGGDLSGPKAKVWENELRMMFTNPPLGPSEVINAVRKMADKLANNPDKYGNTHKPTLQTLAEQIRWTRNRAGGGSSQGRVETEEDACATIAAEPCPFLRWAMILAPSRKRYRENIIAALTRSRIPFEPDIRKHPRYRMRLADPYQRAALEQLQRETPGGELDEDPYLRKVEALHRGQPLEPVPRGENDRFERAVNPAAWKPEPARADHARVIEDAEWR